jgi:hypothetical protein
MESSKSLMKAFEVLDKVIHNTGVSVVMTHHMKKAQGGKAKENNDIADPDSVAGSFLWTGWPNATILVNVTRRSGFAVDRIKDRLNAHPVAMRTSSTPVPTFGLRGDARAASSNLAALAVDTSSERTAKHLEDL